MSHFIYPLSQTTKNRIGILKYWRGALPSRRGEKRCSQNIYRRPLAVCSHELQRRGSEMKEPSRAGWDRCSGNAARLDCSRLLQLKGEGGSSLQARTHCVIPARCVDGPQSADLLWVIWFFSWLCGTCVICQIKCIPCVLRYMCNWTSEIQL